jgi:hypothetical protein
VPANFFENVEAKSAKCEDNMALLPNYHTGGCKRLSMLACGYVKISSKRVYRASGLALEIAMDKFDYSAPAELFPSRNRRIASKVKYRRFDRAAEAIRFAVEELPEPLLLGAYIEINERRLSHHDIRALYESENYPLTRKAS